MSDDGFKVEPEYLRGYADQMSRNGAYMLDIGDYARENALDTAGFSGLMLLLKDSLLKFTHARIGEYDTLKTRLGESAQALKATADDYAHTDTTHAAALDQTYKPGPADQRPKDPVTGPR